MSYTEKLKDLDKNSLSLVGGKNASLGEMIHAGIRVPPGFAVTTTCYEEFITRTGITEKMYELLSGLQLGAVDAVHKASEQVQGLIRNAPMPDDMRSAITDAYAALCEACAEDNLPVAVRSSATAEDLPTASFAGQQDTHLWVMGPDRVLQRVQDCWASLFTPRAVSYRIRNDFPHEKVFISVGVQKMVNAKCAGVMFSLNPTDGDPSKVVIEGAWGLGETVVGGTVNPDRFAVDKVLMEPTEKNVSVKHIACVFDPENGEVKEADLDPEKGAACCLQDTEIKELTKLAKEIETHYGVPMDIEWAIDERVPFPKNVFIVQARPETVWSQKKKESRLGSKTGRELLMAQAMKRIKLKS
ncbi:MAG: PEP/pyruvate-binding domain-containing protein [Desulfobacteraceae bacterium]|jgi:pyruvate,water dikinase